MTVSSGDLRAAAKRGRDMAVRQLREYYGEEHDDPEMLEIIEGHLACFNRILATVHEDDDEEIPASETPETIAWLESLGFTQSEQYCNATHTKMWWHECGIAWRKTYSVGDLDFRTFSMGTRFDVNMTTRGQLRHLLASLSAN